MPKICFIGSGNMAEAIISGILDAGIFKKNEVTGSDVNRERLSYINLKFGIKTCLNNTDEISKCEIIMLSVKPQVVFEVMKDLSPFFNPNALFISILAGVTINKLEKYLSAHFSDSPKIARVMPNMGAFVKKAVSAACFNKYVTEKDREIVNKIFSSIGYVHPVNEDEMNLITAVSGSGPAYIFYFMEMYIDAAIRLGMNKTTAFDFCLETLEGSTQLLSLRKSPPSELCKKVTSKGGTTEAALKILDSKNFRDIFSEALKSSFERAMELGK